MRTNRAALLITVMFETWIGCCAAVLIVIDDELSRWGHVMGAGSAGSAPGAIPNSAGPRNGRGMARQDEPAIGDLVVAGCQPGTDGLSVTLEPYDGGPLPTKTKLDMDKAIGAPRKQSAPEGFARALPAGGIRASLVATTDPHRFAIHAQNLKAGQLYILRTAVDSPSCAGSKGNDSSAKVWLAGGQERADVTILGGSTTLLACPNNQGCGEANQGTAEDAIFTLKKELFQWASSASEATEGTWQVADRPFPADLGSNLLRPPGLLWAGEVEGRVGRFNIDFAMMSVLSTPRAPVPPPAVTRKHPRVNNTQPAQEAPAQGLATGNASDVQPPRADGVTRQGGEAVQGNARGAGPKQKSSLAGQDNPFRGPTRLAGAATKVRVAVNDMISTAQAQGFPRTISRWYVRIVPVAGGKPAGAPSNTVLIRYTTPPLNQIIVNDALSHKPSPYDVRIMSATAPRFPPASLIGCVRVTQYTEVVVPFEGVKKYKAGDRLCPPPPSGDSAAMEFFSALAEGLSSLWGYIADAYNSLKAALVNLVASVVGCGGDSGGTACDLVNAGLKGALDAGLAAVGLPPSLPDANQLVSEGKDYLVDQVADQTGVPADLIRPEVDSAVDAIKQAASHPPTPGWVPAGVPVEPLPEAQYLPGTLVVEIKASKSWQLAQPPFGRLDCQVRAFVTAENHVGQPFFWQDTPLFGVILQAEPFPGPHLERGGKMTIPVVLELADFDPGHYRFPGYVSQNPNSDEGDFLHLGQDSSDQASSGSTAQPNGESCHPLGGYDYDCCADKNLCPVPADYPWLVEWATLYTNAEDGLAWAIVQCGPRNDVSFATARFPIGNPPY